MLSLSSAAPSAAFKRLERVLAAPYFWGLLLLLGCAVRFRQYLFAHSYWYDESFVLLNIRERGLSDLLGPLPYNLISPPMYLWITRLLYELGGDGEILMRLPAFTAGLIALVLMIPLSRQLVGGPHAVWAFLFLVVSRHALDHGCEVHPYTIDLLVTEVLLFASVLLIDPARSDCPRRGPWLILCLAACLGPWLSFPAAFVLAGVSLALAVHLLGRKARREWLLWVLFNGLAAVSGVLLWWFSARHMYYEGMIEHWGHRGWRGFPDWSNPLALLSWLAWRPGEIGNYGNREMGIVLTLLAVIGTRALARRSRALSVLLLGPFTLALAAALLGRFPLVHRTTMFLLPCLWLLAATGIAQVFQYGRAWAASLTCLCLLLLASDVVWLGVGIWRADAHTDYRGAYEFVEARRQPDDLLWAHMGCVYLTYYGTTAPVLVDDQFDEAVRLVTHRRVWVVAGDGRHDFRERLEAAGGRIGLRHHVSGLNVFLFEPGANSTREGETY